MAICMVPPGEEAIFLAPLSATALWGIGPKTAEKLAEMGIHTIGDIRAWPAADLIRRFGQHGEDLMVTTVKLKIRWPDFTTPTRQLTLAQPTDEPELIAETALRLFQQLWTGEQAVRLIGVGVSGLGSPPRQLSFWHVSPAPRPEERARQQR